MVYRRLIWAGGIYTGHRLLFDSCGGTNTDEPSSAKNSKSIVATKLIYFQQYNH